MQPQSRPPLAALAVVCFDQRKGSSIIWHRAIDSELDCGFEFKSLPSGLHAVEEDLIYFTYADNAGLSAFRNIRTDKALRNACQLAVVALVPVEGSRLGRIWMHASGLQSLVRDLGHTITNSSSRSLDLSASLENTLQQVGSLQEYWEAHKANVGADAISVNSQLNDLPSRDGFQNANINIQQRQNEFGVLQSPLLNSPTNSIPFFLDTFGPLIFPLFRLALLRKRILFFKEPPLQSACDYVYILSIFSSLNLAMTENFNFVQPRPDSLFNIGLHDIPELEKRRSSDLRRANGIDDTPLNSQTSLRGWIACTSDEVLASKKDLFDVNVDMRGIGSSPERAWPKIVIHDVGDVLATQRDIRRYKALRRRWSNNFCSLSLRDEDSDGNEEQFLLSHSSTPETGDVLIPREASISEASPLLAIIKDSFVWWASAGERAIELDEEDAVDEALLEASHPRHTESVDGISLSSSSQPIDDDGTQSFELATAVYFRRWMTLIMSTITEAWEKSGATEIGTDSLSEEEVPKQIVQFTRGDLVNMGLDIWSPRDRNFVEELSRLYLGLEADVRGGHIACCGVQIL